MRSRSFLSQICLFAKLLLFLCVSVPIQGQTNEVDSLIQTLTKLEGVEKVDMLNKLSWALKSSEPRNAISYANQSIELSKSIDYNKGLSYGLLHLSVIYAIKSDFSTSDSLSLIAAEGFRKEQDLVGMAKCWNVIGLNNNAKGQYQEAIYYLKKALDVFKELNHVKNILKLEANIANIYYHRGKYDTALVAYQNLVEYSTKINDTNTLISNLGNVGLVQTKFGNYVKALESLYFSLELARQSNDSNRIASVLNHISTTYKELEMADEIITVLNEAISINKKLGNQYALISNYNNIANAYKIKEEYDSAFYYFENALKYAKQFGSHEEGMIYTNIGTIHMDLGNLDSAEVLIRKGLGIHIPFEREEDISRDKFNLGSVFLLKKDYSKAEPLLLESFDYWEEQGIYSDLALNAENLATLYKELGDHELALKYQLIFNDAQDSVFSRAKQNNLTRLLIREQLNQNTILPDETIAKGNKTNYLVVILLFVALGVLGLFIMLTRRKRKINRLEGQLMQKERELAFLSLSSVQKDQFIKKFASNLKNVYKNQPENKSLQTLLKDIKLQNIESNSWESFKSTFEQIAPHFFEYLLNKYPTLTDKELRLCAMIRLNIPSTEMATLLGISLNSVNVAKHRLRKRLQISGKRELESYISTI